MAASVHRLHFASVWVDENRIEVYGYLILTGRHAVLIDSGVGENSPLVERLFRPRRQSLVELLDGQGVKPNDVTTIINSHLHYDHCGNNRLFPQAEILVQKRELQAACQPGYGIRDWFDYDGARLKAVSGDAEVTPGIRLIASHGHTPGHQSVLVEDADQPILIAAQAALSAAEFEAGGNVEEAFEGLESPYLESISRLKSLNARRVCFSHDDRETVQR